MTIKTDLLLIRLEAKFNAALDQIHDITLAKFRTLARSTGQRTKTEKPSPYPTGEVIGPCVCGGWPGGECFRCPKTKPGDWIEP